jgi:type VI secretion system protein VasG
VGTEHGATLAYDEAVVAEIVDRCAERESGARLIDAAIAEAVLPEIGQALLCRREQQNKPMRMTLSVEDGEFGCRIER